MRVLSLNKQQEDVLKNSGHLSTFLEGPAGSGKTTTGVAHLSRLINAGVPSDQILVLLPQRTLAQPYFDEIYRPDYPPGTLPDVLTLGGLARRMIDLFWPLISENSQFARPHLPPKFLTLETAQYFAAKLIQPLLEQGYFETITINRNRIFSQVLDNINKSAVIGFPFTLIGEKLKNAWVGKPEQVNIYTEVQDCANRFREYCLKENLLDYSLQIELFVNQLWPSYLFQEFFFNRYQYLIYDNIEEDVPIAHDLVSQWLPRLANFLLIYDQNGGYRVFLGADSLSGYKLQKFCDEKYRFNSSLVKSYAVNVLEENLVRSIHRESPTHDAKAIYNAMHIHSEKYLPQMVNWVCTQVHSLINDHGIDPAEICILSPYLSDSLRFEFQASFKNLLIPLATHRPSRGLIEEPATQSLLTLTRIIHTEWEMLPTPYEFRNLLMQCITGFDLVRADLLSKIVYHPRNLENPLSSFDLIQSDTQDRISHTIGEKFEILRIWIERYRAEETPSLDVLLSAVFGELLAQPGFGFENNFDAAETTARLIDSYAKFKSVVSENLITNESDLIKEYILMIQEGVIAAQYVDIWQPTEKPSVFLSPAHTFLMANRIVDYQFWLDIGSLGWWERLNQPLTQPYVLSRNWPQDTFWTDGHENEYNRAAMSRLVNGLLGRCRKQVFFCLTNLNEQGMEQRGPLLQTVQSLIRKTGIKLDTQEGDYV